MRAIDTAILDGDVAALRRLIKADSSCLQGNTPSGSTLLELACNKGVIEIIVVLLCHGAPGAMHFARYREILTEYLAEISGDWTGTGWYNGIEFIVWSLVVGDRDEFFFSEDYSPLRFDAVQKTEWLLMSKHAGGWPTGEGFLSGEQWKQFYESQSAATE